jgi:hypothetical protein
MNERRSVKSTHEKLEGTAFLGKAGSEFVDQFHLVLRVEGPGADDVLLASIGVDSKALGDFVDPVRTERS